MMETSCFKLQVLGKFGGGGGGGEDGFMPGFLSGRGKGRLWAFPNLSWKHKQLSLNELKTYLYVHCTKYTLYS